MCIKQNMAKSQTRMFIDLLVLSIDQIQPREYIEWYYIVQKNAIFFFFF